MTNNAWNTPYPNTNGKTLIGNGTSRPSSNTITSGTNCSVVNDAGSIKFTFSGSTAGDWDLLGSASITSATASVEFLNLTNTYSSHVIVIDNYSPDSTSEILLKMQISSNNGSTWTSNHWIVGWFKIGTAAQTLLDDVNVDGIYLIGNADHPSAPSNASNSTGSCLCIMHGLIGAGSHLGTNICIFKNNAGTSCFQVADVYANNDSIINAIRFLGNSGNIGKMELRFYGLRS